LDFPPAYLEPRNLTARATIVVPSVLTGRHMTVATLSKPPTTAPPSSRRPVVDQARLVGLAVGVGAIVTIGLWLRHGGVANATGPGATATAVGQVTALVGTYAILVQILFMSRIAWLERAVGLDHLAVWHRWLGFATVWLITAHVVFTTVGYAAGDKVSLWSQTRDFISHYPDVLMAWVGFLLFVAVAVASVRAARRKLQRETWYFIHLYAYLAVALSFAHQIAVGSDLDNDRAARIWWIGVYVLVFGAILWWRILEPVRLNLRHGLRVHSVKREAPGIVSIMVSGRRVDRIGVEPGQFFLWRFLTREMWWKTHPFSLSAAPTKKYLRVTVKDLGDGSKQLQRIRPGTRVVAEGPYGTFTDARRKRRGVLLIAGGIGITPLRAMLDGFGASDDVVLLYRIADERDAVFVDELRDFDARPNVRIHIIAGSEIGDDRTDLLSVPALQRGVPDVHARDCFVCGPPPLIAAMRRRLTMLGVPRAHIHFERFEL
jgi:predicted ferric reductase